MHVPRHHSSVPAGQRPAHEPRSGQRAPSPLQRRVLEFVASSARNGVIEATAGSGKTTTLVQVAGLLPTSERACFLAFNRVTATELRARLPAHVHATTLHALGLATLRAHMASSRSAAPDPGKYRRLGAGLLPPDTPSVTSTAASLSRLADLTRLTLTPATDAKEVQRLAARFGLSEHTSGGGRDWSNALLAPLLDLGLARVAEGDLDFTDMLHAPVALSLRPEPYAFVSVDEAQDLSPLALEFVRLLVSRGARALFVGDPHQAIYGFAGAGHDSLRRAAELTSATTLPLSVSFRCPRRHVLLARRFSPDMTSAPGARAGRVSLLPARQLAEVVRPGDLIMSRVNEPLVGVALSVAARGVPVRLLGSDLAGPVAHLAGRVLGAGPHAAPPGVAGRAPQGAPRWWSPTEAEEAVVAHEATRRRSLEHELLGSAALAEALRANAEWHGALRLALRGVADRGPVQAEDLLRAAEEVAGRLFVVVDEVAALGGLADPHKLGLGPDGLGPDGLGHDGPGHDGPGPRLGLGLDDCVVLSTIHKAKGREADRVFLLYPEELAPHGSGPPTVQHDAEENVLFVALTRAKQELFLVERTRGAVTARVARHRAPGRARAGGATLALATPGALPSRWDEVLALAALMSREGGSAARLGSSPRKAGRRAGGPRLSRGATSAR